MFYNIVRIFLVVLYKILFRYEVIGKHHIPEKGAVLLCSNHISLFDPPIIGIHLKRRINFMAKEELFKIPVLGFCIRQLGAFPVKRGASDKRAIRTSLELLRDNKIFAIFPEGTRSKSGEIGKGLSGAGLIALKEPCTVVPVAITGPYHPFKKMKVVYGSPVNIDDLRGDKVTKEAAQEATERMMNAIRTLYVEHKPS